MGSDLRPSCPALPCPAARADPTLARCTASGKADEDGWSAGAELMLRASPRQWSNINETLLRSEAVGDELKSMIAWIYLAEMLPSSALRILIELAAAEQP